MRLAVLLLSIAMPATCTRESPRVVAVHVDSATVQHLTTGGRPICAQVRRPHCVEVY